MARVQQNLLIPFSVVGSITNKRLFPKSLPLPYPGQYVYISSTTYGVTQTLAQITSLKISLSSQDFYQVEIQLNRVSLTEDIIMQRLNRKQIDLIDSSTDISEPFNLTDDVTKAELLSIAIIPALPEYSGANYSNVAYSGA